MKKILVTAAGGSPATGFIRSLRSSSEQFYIVGVDANVYHLQRAESDEKYLVPKIEDVAYFPVLEEIIRRTKVTFLHVQVSAEVISISKRRKQLLKLGVKTLLPRHETIVICEDKMKSYKIWKNAGLKVPNSMLIRSPKDIRQAFKKFGKRIWLREISGSAGKGAISTDSYQLAKIWIESRQGWGRFMAAEHLTADSVTWQSVWKDGKLLVGQGRKRLYWEFANRAPSGITGITGTCISVNDPVIDRTAKNAILSIDKKPNGVFGVDMTYDRNGIPNPTEINSARFMTTHQFFTTGGVNMPYIMIKAAFNEAIPQIARKENPLTPGLAWIRGMDTLPIFTDTKVIESSVRSLEEIKQELGVR